MREKLLSDSEKNISWRLNDLLRAGEKAKSFAAINWTDDASSSSKNFKSWNPADTAESLSEKNSDASSEALTIDSSVIDNEMDEQQKIDLAIKKSYSEGYEKGFSEGVEKEGTELKTIKNNLQSLINQINDSNKSLQSFFDPLKTLSLSLAQSLVKGNLSVTDALINRLVSDVLAEIDKTHSGEIIIQMNPKDISQLHDQVLKEFSYVEFVENNDISNGNIKIIMGDTIIEDFIEKKLDELAAKLFNELPIENSESNISREITERDNARLEEAFTQSDVEIIDDDQPAEVSSNEDETIVEDPDKSESSDDQ